MHPPKTRSSAWKRVLEWAYGWLEREAQARARVCLNRGRRMWE
jgi:hypothetical protein